jgi:hypothetical protein
LEQFKKRPLFFVRSLNKRLIQKIGALRPKDDGLKRFNFLYLKITLEVLRNPSAGGWSSGFDVIFAGLYFEAIRDWTGAARNRLVEWGGLMDGAQQHAFAKCEDGGDRQHHGRIGAGVNHEGRIK